MNATEARANLEGGAANGAARLSGCGTGTKGATPSGATEAAGEFVLTNYKWIRRLAHRAAKPLAMEDEDAVHELVIWVLKKHPKYDPERGKPTTFLNAVVRSFFSFEQQKRNTKMRTGLTRVDLSRVGPEAGSIDALVADERAPDPAADAADAVDRAALEVATDAALGAIPANRAQLVRELFGIGRECVTVRDVAAREGVTAHSILERRNTALRALRPQLHQFAGGCRA